ISIEEEAIKRGYSINTSYSEMISKLALQVALGKLGLEEAIENASNKIFGDLYRSTLDILMGRLVGGGGRSFIVIYTSSGSDPYAASREFFSKVSNAIKREYPGASILWTGSNVINEDLKRISSEDIARISRVSEILVFIVLLAILGSIAAVILPYAGIVLGVVVGGGIAFFIASGGIADMLSLTRTLIYVIPLGLGSDYAAYLVYRFREEYARLGDPRKASEEALRRAGPAIVASALTVIAGFGSLALGWEFPLFRSLGVYMPLVVAVTAASCLTLVPAILSIAGGSRVFWWGVRRSMGIDRAGYSMSKISRTFIRMGPVIPIIFVIVSIASIAIYPVISFSHDLRLFLPSNSPSIIALDTIASDMGYGQVFPSYIVIVKSSAISTDDLVKIESLASRISGLDGVQSVEGPTRPFGTPINISTSSLEDPAVSAYISNNITYMRVVIKKNTFSSEAIDLIERIREITKEWASTNGYSVYIGGATATSEELDRLVNSLFWYRVLPFAVISMILIFTLVFGSFLAAVLAVLLVVLSSLISMVLTGIVFNSIFLSPVLWFLPQVVFTAMLGVGMDYNSFYMARAREICLVEGECSSKGVARASGIIGRLIMGLAMVMAAAFGSLMLSSSIGLREIGFSLLASVLLIASAVSYLVIPPILSMIGRRMWVKRGSK
ncbi:MAG: MMPL family transporter, partial [Sulfolobales archaeon]